MVSSKILSEWNDLLEFLICEQAQGRLNELWYAGSAWNGELPSAFSRLELSRAKSLAKGRDFYKPKRVLLVLSWPGVTDVVKGAWKRAVADLLENRSDILVYILAE